MVAPSLEATILPNEIILSPTPRDRAGQHIDVRNLSAVFHCPTSRALDLVRLPKGVHCDRLHRGTYGTGSDYHNG